VFESGVLRKVFGPKKESKQGSGEYYVMRSFMLCIRYPMFFEGSNQEE
jgi:hypothetical protein